MELKLILDDNTEILLSDANFIEKFSTICNTQEEILYLWNKLSFNNTKRIKVKLGNEIIQIISNAKVTGYQMHQIINENTDQNNFFVTFFYTSASYTRDIEKENNDIARILLGEE